MALLGPEGARQRVSRPWSLKRDRAPIVWVARRDDFARKLKAIFSKGRGLRGRIATPYGWQGLSLPPVVRREAFGLMGMHEEGARPPYRACRARPSKAWRIQGEMA
jgi:hypothetical protein